MSFINPPPNFSGWENDLFNLDGERYRSTDGLDDGTIKKFYENRSSTEYNADELLVILKTKLRPLTDKHVTNLDTFIATPKVIGNNYTATGLSFSNCVHDVAVFARKRHTLITKLISYVEVKLPKHQSPGSPMKCVSEIRKSPRR